MYGSIVFINLGCSSSRFLHPGNKPDAFWTLLPACVLPPEPGTASRPRLAQTHQCFPSGTPTLVRVLTAVPVSTATTYFLRELGLRGRCPCRECQLVTLRPEGARQPHSCARRLPWGPLPAARGIDQRRRCRLSHGFPRALLSSWVLACLTRLLRLRDTDRCCPPTPHTEEVLGPVFLTRRRAVVPSGQMRTVVYSGRDGAQAGPAGPEAGASPERWKLGTNALGNFTCLGAGTLHRRRSAAPQVRCQAWE